MAKKKEPPAEEGSPAWMSTFSDLMNLLLCFFVLLFASSTMDEGKIQKIAASFDNISFSIIDSATFSLVDGDMMSAGVAQIPDAEKFLAESGVTNSETDNVDIGDNMATVTDATGKESEEEINEEYEKIGEEESQEMYDEVVSLEESYNIDTQIMTDYSSKYVELDLSGSILFDSGSAEVKDEAKMFLQKLASILVKYKYNIIEIEGHTDNVPISNSKYENNRDLSAARARKVYEYISTQENFIDENMKIAGYGDSRPVASNATEEGRAKNRRVVIKIYNKQNSNE